MSSTLVITVALAWVVSIVMTCRRAPYSAPTLRTLDILAATCRRAPYPVSTLRTIEPEWRSWAPQLVVWARGAAVAALALELPLVVIVVVGGGASTSCGFGGSACTSGWGGSSSTSRSPC